MSNTGKGSWVFRAITGLWRWRHNPLCRRSDRTESWFAVCALLLIVLGSPLAGSVAGEAAHRTLHASSRAQHEQRQQVWATVLRVLPRHAPGQEKADELTNQQRVLAAWAGPNGTSHKEALSVAREVSRGDQIRLWTDAHGALTSRPMTPATASSHAALAGLVVAFVAAAVMELVRRLVVRILLHQRYLEWERQWAKVGPDWGRSWPAASG